MSSRYKSQFKEVNVTEKETIEIGFKQHISIINVKVGGKSYKTPNRLINEEMAITFRTHRTI